MYFECVSLLYRRFFDCFSVICNKTFYKVYTLFSHTHLTTLSQLLAVGGVTRSHRKRSYSISNIGNMMGCDHLSCVPVAPFAGELWHFEYFPTTTVRQLLIFDHTTVTVVRICCCIPNFTTIGSRVRPPDAHNC